MQPPSVHSAAEAKTPFSGSMRRTNSANSLQRTCSFSCCVPGTPSSRADLVNRSSSYNERIHRSSSALSARPKLLCRICEHVVDQDAMEDHSRQCLREVIVFTVGKAMSNLQEALERDLSSKGGKADGSSSGSNSSSRRSSSRRGSTDERCQPADGDSSEAAESACSRPVPRALAAVTSPVMPHRRLSGVLRRIVDSPVMVRQGSGYSSEGRLSACISPKGSRSVGCRSPTSGRCSGQSSPGRSSPVPLRCEASVDPAHTEASLLSELLEYCRELRALSLEIDRPRLLSMRNRVRETQFVCRRAGLGRLLSPYCEQLQSAVTQLLNCSDEHEKLRPSILPVAEKTRQVTIDSFEILKPISRGAYGQVVLAAKKTTQDLYAIKVIKKKATRRKNNVRRIMTERDVLARSEHPFVVKLFYSFHTKENLYMVMEFVNGGDLFSLLKNLGCLDEQVAMLYVAEIVLALEYLHFELGVVHRDLKPENVLIHHDGHIKLTDFGLSAFGYAEVGPTNDEDWGDDYDDESETELRQKVGTPDYMAPELLLMARQGRPVDLWALGCLTFELLTGYTPFNAPSVPQVFEKILEHITTDSVLWPQEEELSPEAEDLCRQLLDPLPECRLGAESTAQLVSHAFFEEIEDWEALHFRKGEVPFVPSLDANDDTSYFIPKSRHQSKTNNTGKSEGKSDVPGSPAGTHPRPDEDEEETDDFLNFTYNNLATLMQKNLELVRGEKKGNLSPGGRSESKAVSSPVSLCSSTAAIATAASRLGSGDSWSSPGPGDKSDDLSGSSISGSITASPCAVPTPASGSSRSSPGSGARRGSPREGGSSEATRDGSLLARRERDAEPFATRLCRDSN